ncbi:MAG: acyl-CoA dehydrogenase family protein, partial [Polyangiaceae bacterium]
MPAAPDAVNESWAPAREAVEAIAGLYEIARERLRSRVLLNGKLSAAALDREQLAAHALAYVATDLAACLQVLA